MTTACLTRGPKQPRLPCGVATSNPQARWCEKAGGAQKKGQKKTVKKKTVKAAQKKA
jgi:hypothetical protein